MVGAALHNLGHVLRLLVDGHGPHAGARRGWQVNLQLHGAGLGQLAEQLVEGRRVLHRKKKVQGQGTSGEEEESGPHTWLDTC